MAARPAQAVRAAAAAVPVGQPDLLRGPAADRLQRVQHDVILADGPAVLQRVAGHRGDGQGGGRAARPVDGGLRGGVRREVGNAREDAGARDGSTVRAGDRDRQRAERPPTGACGSRTTTSSVTSGRTTRTCSSSAATRSTKARARPPGLRSSVRGLPLQVVPLALGVQHADRRDPCRRHARRPRRVPRQRLGRGRPAHAARTERRRGAGCRRLQAPGAVGQHGAADADVAPARSRGSRTRGRHRRLLHRHPLRRDQLRGRRGPQVQVGARAAAAGGRHLQRLAPRPRLRCGAQRGRAGRGAARRTAAHLPRAVGRRLERRRVDEGRALANAVGRDGDAA